MPDADLLRPLLTENHLDLLEGVSRFAHEELEGRAEPADDDAGRIEARVLLSLMGEAGWYRAIEQQDFRGCCLIREALAGASPLADAVFALQALGTTPLILSENEGLRDLWLERALSGDAMSAFAMTEPDAGSDVSSLSTRLSEDGDELVLSGKKTLISNAGLADFYCVFATADPSLGSKGIACVLVEAEDPGLSFSRAQVMSSPHPLGEIELNDCRLSRSRLLAPPGEGFRLGMATLDRLRATVGAAACGMAERALVEATAHALERKQFGKPLAEFQLVQAKLADMATDLTASRLLVYRAAWEADQGKERVTLESSMAKLHATEAAQRIVDDAVQIVGGQGALMNHPVDRLYRSVRALRIYEGTSEIQKLVIAGHLIRAARDAGPGDESKSS